MKKRAALALTALLVAGFVGIDAAPNAGAHEGGTASGAPGAAKTARKVLTLRGEVLDMSCYVARGFSGPVHRDCALRCIASGVCMGMIGPDSMLYMLTLDHARAMAPTTFTTPDPFGQCKDWAGQAVEISGMAYERGGMHIIEVVRAKLLPAPTPP
ncbi:MAG: hypothetical protein ACRENN_00800 [Candidatus Eiseniibacteriota bacterium]